MDQIYSANGIEFRYPGTWELSEEPQERDVVVSVLSPETSFWTVSLLEGRPDPKRVIREVLDTFRGEYLELDEYHVDAKLNHTPCEARDLQFVQYELINSAFLRACQTGLKTVLVLYQGNDEELQTTRSLLEQISESLTWEESSSSLMGGY